MQNVHLKFNERAVLVRDGRAERVLGPGRYTLWKRYEVVRFDTDELVFSAPAIVQGAVPEEWYQRVEIAAGHYGIVLREQRAVAFLRPGLHRVWAVDRRIEVRVYPSTEAIADGDLTPELRKTIPPGELYETSFQHNHRGVLVRDGQHGRPVKFLRPGVHRYWTGDDVVELRAYDVDQPRCPSSPTSCAR
jgi:hypothetical protein